LQEAVVAEHTVLAIPDTMDYLEHPAAALALLVAAEQAQPHWDQE
jgi:hypothetical protein